MKGKSILHPAARAELLRNIDPKSAADHHSLLRRILRLEIERRRENPSPEHAENLFWCAYLLHMIGDPCDVPLIWQIRGIDFDAGCYFDALCLVGAGYHETMKYLESHGYDEIAEYVRGVNDTGELEDLHAWRSHKLEFYYA